MVKCEICGGHFNERFLASHKRLAHRRKGPSTDKEVVEQILKLFKRLTKEGQHSLVHRLSTVDKPVE
jgi:hypothetical protein